MHYVFYITAGVIAIFGFVKKISNDKIEQLIQQCKEHTLQQKYQLFHHDQTNEFNDFNSAHYPLFKLGNYRNYLQDFRYGSWQVEQTSYPCMLFNYHYIDEVTTSDDDDNEKTSYRHYDLWGIIIHQFPVKGISIASQQKKVSRLGTKWSTGDIHFDRQYQTSGINEMELAKFFTPTHLLILDKIMEKFKGDFYIHPQLNALCWLFNCNIFSEQTSVHTVKSTSDLAHYLTDYRLPYYEELEAHIQLFLKEIYPDYVLEKNECDL